jgi:hypothetical protein
MSNTHRAYVRVHEGAEENAHDPKQTRLVTYDPPRHKMIASGRKSFCEEMAAFYLVEGNPWGRSPHPDAEIDVVEVGDQTAAWDAEWKEVKW